MSYYNKHAQSASLTPDGERKVMQALLTAELETRNLSEKSAYLEGLKTDKKHSSATLLRRKLKTTLVREFREI